MPPDPDTTAAGGFGKRLSTVPAALGYYGHHLVHLLDRQQPAEGPAVPWLAAPVPSGGWRFPARWCLRWVGRRRTRRIRGVLAQPGFQIADALLQGPDERLGGARGRGPDFRRQGRIGALRSRRYTASL